MITKKWLPPLVAAFAIAALPAWSAVPRATIDVAPPTPLEAETMPPQRDGYVWSPGYWDYEGARHTWRKGHWVQARRGYRYEPAHWAQENGRWSLYAENWVSDEDGKDPRSAASRADGTQLR